MAEVLHPPAYPAPHPQAGLNPVPLSPPHNSGQVTNDPSHEEVSSSPQPADYSYYDPSSFSVTAPSTRRNSTASLLPSYSISSPPRPRYGPGGLYNTEEDYLNALRSWAEKKKFARAPQHSLVGFYGTKTVEDYANQPRPTFGRKRKHHDTGSGRDLSAVPEGGEEQDVAENERQHGGNLQKPSSAMGGPSPNETPQCVQRMESDATQKSLKRRSGLMRWLHKKRLVSATT